MKPPRVLVLRAAGINCDEETAFAWSRAGAEAQVLHVNRLIEQPTLLESFNIVTVPGGFSYGDDIASGKILAVRIRHALHDHLSRFVERGGMILGICNGFQVLVKSGLLPGGDLDGRVTVTFNDTDRYEARWVHVNVATDKCAFLRRGAPFLLPVAHGEGKVITRDAETLANLQRDHHIALTYCDAQGRTGAYPVNPNGSEADIAGLTDATGRILGLMPHPERAIDPTHVPDWTSSAPDRGPGQCIFENAVHALVGV